LVPADGGGVVGLKMGPGAGNLIGSLAGITLSVGSVAVPPVRTGPGNLTGSLTGITLSVGDTGTKDLGCEAGPLAEGRFEEWPGLGFALVALLINNTDARAAVRIVTRFISSPDSEGGRLKLAVHVSLMHPCWCGIRVVTGILGFCRKGDLVSDSSEYAVVVLKGAETYSQST
jgi:hypothetical protein